MGFFTNLFTSNTAEPIEAMGNVFDKLFTSDDERLQAAAVMEKLRQHPGELQTEIGKIQAQHRSIWVAGARPFLMWVCGVGLAMAFIANPLIEFYTEGKELINVPLDVIMELVIAMLGLSTLRTVEKLQGKTK